MSKIVLIGGVGTAVNVIEQIKKQENKDKIIGVVIDSFDIGSNISGVPVIGGLKDIQTLLKQKDVKFIFSLYKPDCMEERSNLLDSLNIPLERFTNIIHPSSYIAPSVKIGLGNVILPNTTIQSNVNIGNFNIINSNVTIEHETKLDNNNFIAANVVIGAKCHLRYHNFIGLNTAIREGVHLNKVFVGMQSLVLNDFYGCKILGIPAKKYL